MIRSIFLFLCKFSYWGICFLLILIFGLNVTTQEILNIALSGKLYLSLYSWYLICSAPIFIFTFIIHILGAKKLMPSFIDRYNLSMFVILQVPYAGFNTTNVITSLKDDYGDRASTSHEILILLRHLFESLVWWGIVAFGVYTVFHQTPNAILTAIEFKTDFEKLKLLGIVLAIYVARIIINGIARMIINKFIR